MSFELREIFEQMGPFAFLIVAVLVIMALASASVFFERLFTYWLVQRRTLTYSQEAIAMLGRKDYALLLEHSRAQRSLPFAQLSAAALGTWLDTPTGGELPLAELVRREVARRIETLHAQLRRGMGVLASVGSVAPFVGLLGTVVGIIDAFQSIAAEGSGGLGAVSAGISEALVVTALGLVVAIPAVLAFNFLNGRLDGLMLGLNTAAGELVDHIEHSGSPHRAEPVVDSGLHARPPRAIKAVS